LEVNNDDFDRQAVLVPLHACADLRAWIASAKGGPLKILTVRSLPTPRAEVAAQHALQCARIAADNKASDVKVLDMRGITPLYDSFVLATGASRRQIHNIAEEIDAAMAADGETRLGIEGYDAGRWVVQDYGDIVVHVFDQETRGYYALDDLWADAKRM